MNIQVALLTLSVLAGSLLPTSAGKAAGACDDCLELICHRDDPIVTFPTADVSVEWETVEGEDNEYCEYDAEIEGCHAYCGAVWQVTVSVLPGSPIKSLHKYATDFDPDTMCDSTIKYLLDDEFCGELSPSEELILEGHSNEDCSKKEWVKCAIAFCNCQEGCSCAPEK